MMYGQLPELPEEIWLRIFEEHCGQTTVLKTIMRVCRSWMKLGRSVTSKGLELGPEFLCRKVWCPLPPVLPHQSLLMTA